jgi:hypothetical protein
MSPNDLKPSDFDRLDEASRIVFEGLAKKIQPSFPALKAILGRTTTETFPLYSHITFEDKARPEIDPVVVGVDVRVDSGKILIQAHIIGEETGAAYFDVPNQELPFGTDWSVLQSHVINAAQQLAENTIPVLERVFDYAKPLRAPA